MTTYCLSSTVRSRPTAFLFAAAGGERQPQLPVPPNYSVDTPFDDPLLDEPGEEDEVLPFGRPAKKGVPDDDRNLP
jgi:hypothetical protein